MRQQLRRLWYRMFPDHPLTYPGRVIVSLLPPGRLSAYETGFFTGTPTEGFFGRILRTELNRRYYRSSDAERRRLNRQHLWGGQAGREWHELQRRRFTTEDESFRKFRQPLVAALQQLRARDSRFRTVCEIGTGNGLFLEHLSQQIPGVDRFVGIDLNADLIRDNQTRYNGSRLEFERGELSDWLDRARPEGLMLVTVGTLECFTEGELLELFAALKSRVQPVAVALSEPVSMDVRTETASKPRGNTMYSHNYRHQLDRAGYAIEWERIEPIDPSVPGYDTVMILARGDASDGR